MTSGLGGAGREGSMTTIVPPRPGQGQAEVCTLPVMVLQVVVRRRWLVPLAAFVLLLALPGLALGHAELETASPADKSTVTEPVVEVSGIYSQAMQPDGSSLVVKDSNGTQVAKGTVDPEDDTRMVATPATPLGDGVYLVESTSLATDGDIAHATWTFTVAVAASPSSSPTESAAPSSAPTASAAPTAVATTAPPPSIVASPSPSGTGTTTGSTGDVVLPIIVALLVLAAGAAYLLTRRNRPSDPGGPTNPSTSTTPPTPPATPSSPPGPPADPT